MNLRSRLSRLENYSRNLPRPDIAASERWHRLLKLVFQWLFETGQSQIAGRVKEAISFLDSYRARRVLGPNVEETCRSWLLSFNRKTGRGAYFGTDIARVLRERDRIDRCRRPTSGFAL